MARQQIEGRPVGELVVDQGGVRTAHAEDVFRGADAVRLIDVISLRLQKIADAEADGRIVLDDEDAVTRHLSVLRAQWSVLSGSVLQVYCFRAKARFL